MNNNGIIIPPSVFLEFTRVWQLNFCDGNVCAAELLSLYECQYAHKLSIRFKNKDSFDFESAIKNFKNKYSNDVVVVAKKLLLDKGIMSVLPISNFSSLNQSIYLFHPEVCNAWLEANNNNKCRTGRNNNNSNLDNQGQDDRAEDMEGTQTKPPALNVMEVVYEKKIINFLRKKLETTEIIYKNLTKKIIRHRSIENTL